MVTSHCCPFLQWGCHQIEEEGIHDMAVCSCNTIPRSAHASLLTAGHTNTLAAGFDSILPALVVSHMILLLLAMLQA